MKDHAIRNLLMAAASASLLVASTSAFAADEQPAAVATVLNKLHESNQKEVHMGQQAKEQGQSQAVKDYGATLERDHTAADEKVAALARKKNVELPAVAPDHAKHPTPDGASFDADFAKMMVTDHKKDIEEVKSARDAATDTDLKELLTDLLPTLEKHLQTAESLAK